MHNLDTEHGRAIYCYAVGSGAVLGGGVTAGSMGIKVMVGEGGDKPGWYTEVDGDGSRDGGGG